jgi:CubicO group peptidase (beta-lactamase class C family)
MTRWATVGPAAALLSMVCVVPAHAARGTAGEAARIQDLVERYAATGHFSGCALVARGDRVLYRGALGLANREWEIPLTPDARFMIGSLSKALTATVVLQLVQEGKLSLDTPLSDLLPEFPRDRGERITTRHLLTHTSGLGNHGQIPGFETRLERLPHSRAEMIALIGGMEMEGEPGESFAYSSFGYDLLAFACEHLEDRPFAEILERRILAPAGMGHTSLADPRSLEERRAAGYEYDLVPGFENASFVDASNMVGGGGVLSTVDDLHRWVRALSDGRLLPEPWLAEMQRSQVATDPGTGYGYGWFVSAAADGRGPELWHPGSTNGFTSFLSWTPDEDELVVLLSNVRSSVLWGNRRYKLGTLREGLRSILGGGTAAPPERSAVMAVSPVAMRSGGKAAVEAYRRLARDHEGDHYFDELELNLLGLHLLFKEGRAEDALEVLALNVEEHPDSYNVYDTMGYVLLQEGRTEEALACYRQGVAVFEADPAANEAYRSDYEKAVKRLAEADERPTRGRRPSRAGGASR